MHVDCLKGSVVISPVVEIDVKLARARVFALDTRAKRGARWVMIDVRGTKVRGFIEF